MWSVVKLVGSRLLGRELANRLSAPLYDYQARRRSAGFLRKLPSSGLRVNLGCGPRPLPGWVNVDLFRAEGVDVVWDIREGLPFADQSCAAILAEHVIEHISEEDALTLAIECRRVLEPGGILRVSTPDAGRFLQSYADDRQFLFDQRFTKVAETAMDRINLMMRQDGLHLWVYDDESLSRLLQRAGFETVVVQQFGASINENLSGIDCTNRRFESLYIEAKK